MKVLRYTDEDYVERLLRLEGESSLFNPEIEERVRRILEEVRVSGDQAVLALTEKFDGLRLRPEQLALTQAEHLKASTTVTASFRQAVKAASKNIERFAKRGLRKDWSMVNTEGGKVGEKFDPFQRVGIYIPGGTAPLASTALMTIILARVAGCPEIVVCTPGKKDGSIDPAVLFAAKTSGATEVYRVGGAQAIAAMAYGTSAIGRVQKVFGPGNAYVVTAKRLLFGWVAVDLLPGPSELLVLADDSAKPDFVAADLLAQAEHGSGHERVWLVTTSPRLLQAVEKEIERQLKRLTRHEYVRKALDANGWLIHVEDVNAAVALTNRLAPEHCEVMTRQAQKRIHEIKTAGAIFVGSYSPTVLGDYMAGPSHTLPTGGAGYSFAGLTVDQFQRRTSVVEYTRTALDRSLPTIAEFAQLEGLDAHGTSASVRIKRRSAKD